MSFLTRRYSSGLNSPTPFVHPESINWKDLEAQEIYKRSLAQAQCELSKYLAPGGTPLPGSPGTFDMSHLRLEDRDSYPGDGSFLEKWDIFLASVRDRGTPVAILSYDSNTPPHQITNFDRPVSPLKLNSTAGVTESSTQTNSKNSDLNTAPPQAGLRDQEKGSTNAIPPVTISDMISRWQIEK
ncbi:hypothetical protein V865_006220 [Kwoniella europaea PYCC6329]|uniref:Succinate dehydrogenase assembly factor 3, mitochondrial n=1 Tax=Kwoniella europaea PYCC6329 TaxID=1423913 RepID=A0AAX4KQ71_9TREE